MAKAKRVQFGTVTVDSGRIFICDPCNRKSDNASVICKHTIAVHTAYGDGVYPVYAKRDKQGRIVKIEIDLGLTKAHKEFLKRLKK